MEGTKKKVVVAYSGGLDTSYTVMYLAKKLGYEVYAACADTGGFSPAQLKANEENAYKLGAKHYVTLDVTQEYYAKSLKYMIYGNVLRNGTYPISVSSERIFQAIAIARYANEVGADAIAHGSTGAGNDQVRFDMTFLVMAPGVEILTLTRDNALSRDEEIEYLRSNGFVADDVGYFISHSAWRSHDCFTPYFITILRTMRISFMVLTLIPFSNFCNTNCCTSVSGNSHDSPNAGTIWFCTVSA